MLSWFCQRLSQRGSARTGEAITADRAIVGKIGAALRGDLEDSSTEQFHQDVLASMRAISRAALVLQTEEYSLQVFAVTLAVHLKTVVLHCLRERHLTESQVHLLLEPLLRSLPPGAASRTADRR